MSSSNNRVCEGSPRVEDYGWAGLEKPRFWDFFRFLGFLGFKGFLGFNVHNAEVRYMTHDK